MQLQPPPGAPAPPPSEAAILSRKKWKWMWILGLLSVVVVVVFGSPLFFRRGCVITPEMESNRGLRQMGIALYEFETEYGGFPAPTTIMAVQAATGSDIPLGTVTSNDFFRQLLASGASPSESIFYARLDLTHKPDGVVTKAEALKKGECGYTYFLGAKITDNPSRPMVVASMIPGTDRFDPKPFEGKAVILKLDNSVASLPIDKDGHVLINGRNMMDPHHPIWEGHAPVIAWPDL